jgi:chemotaxis protein methyltransferase WspC
MTARALIRRATGLDLSEAAAEHAVQRRLGQTAFADRAAYLRGLTPDELEQLIELVIVPESWLFRDLPAFEAMVEFVLSRRPGAAGPLRILSLPCAGGEEPYSIAMALRDAGVPREAVSIDAFDLSAACIARAKAGVYGRNAFRAPELGFRERYFSKIDGEAYRVVDSLREQIHFRQGNLLQFDAVQYTNYYDVIFCRNLLIYFDKPTAKAAIDKLAAILRDDGILLAGYAEVPTFRQHGFETLPNRQAFALKKSVAGAAPQPAPVNPSGAAPRGARPGAPKPAPTPPAPVFKARPGAVRPAAPTPPAAPPDLRQACQLADLGRFREAGEQCRAHLAAAPDSAEAYFILGMLNEQAGQVEQAEADWRRCVYLQPDHYEALCHLALLAEAQGDKAGASALRARAARLYQRQQIVPERER